jgi:hypothetical protein
VARTTAVLVRGVIEVAAAVDLSPFIATANSVVNDHCTTSGYSDEKLELIERWLAAHFTDVMLPRSAQEGVTGAVGAYQQFERVAVDLYLNNTKYGQQAMALDPAKTLAAFNNSLSHVKELAGGVSTEWLGTEYD